MAYSILTSCRVADAAAPCARKFPQEEARGKHLKRGQAFKTLRYVTRMFSGFPISAQCLGAQLKVKHCLTLYFMFSVCMLKSYDLYLISSFYTYPASNKCISPFISDTFLYKKSIKIISKKEQIENLFINFNNHVYCLKVTSE